MAACASHPVDVVPAVRRPEGRVHLLDIQPAVGHLRMTGRTRRSCLLSVLGMTREAADSLVDTNRRSIIPAAYLYIRHGRVALVAERLPLVLAHLHGAFTLAHRRNGE